MGQSLIKSSKKLGNSQPLAPRRLCYAKISNMQNRLPLNGTGISLDGCKPILKTLKLHCCPFKVSYRQENITLKNLILQTLAAQRKHGESLWRSKSCIQWLATSDLNTSFFHLSTVIHRRKNDTECIKTTAVRGPLIHQKSPPPLHWTIPYIIYVNPPSSPKLPRWFICPRHHRKRLALSVRHPLLRKSKWHSSNYSQLNLPVPMALQHYFTKPNSLLSMLGSLIQSNHFSFTERS